MADALWLKCYGLQDILFDARHSWSHPQSCRVKTYGWSWVRMGGNALTSELILVLRFAGVDGTLSLDVLGASGYGVPCYG